MKINKLEIENVKRIKAVKIEPTKDGLTIIGGKNNQGKTSVLDSIAWALGGERFIGELPVVECKEQHAAALRAVVIDLFPIGVKIAAEDDLRRAEKVGLILMERNAPVFLRARERERGDRALIHLAGEEFAHGGHGVVIAAHRRAVVRHDHVDILGDEPVGAERDDIVHDHFVFRHRAGLVHAERIDARERFDAVHLAAQAQGS